MKASNCTVTVNPIFAPSITASTCWNVTKPELIASTESNATAVLLGVRMERRNPAPNPRRVRIYLAEKGLSVPSTTLSIRDMEHKGAAFLKVNPLGQIPALELDDGSVITESIVHKDNLIVAMFTGVKYDAGSAVEPKNQENVSRETRRIFTIFGIPCRWVVKIFDKK